MYIWIVNFITVLYHEYIVIKNVIIYFGIFQYPGMDFSKAQLQKNYDTIPGLNNTS